MGESFSFDGLVERIWEGSIEVRDALEAAYDAGFEAAEAVCRG